MLPHVRERASFLFQRHVRELPAFLLPSLRRQRGVRVRRRGQGKGGPAPGRGVRINAPCFPVLVFCGSVFPRRPPSRAGGGGMRGVGGGRRTVASRSAVAWFLVLRL